MKKFMSIILACFAIINTLSPCAFAATLGPEYTYRDGDKEIVYYLDEEGFPYNYSNGEKTYLLLPLDSLKITDEKELAELNKAINDSYNYNCTNDGMLRAVPTSYYDLTTLPKEQNSRKYTQFMTFEASTSITTQTMKVHTEHSKIRVQTLNLDKPHWYDNKKVIVYINYYDETLQGWYALHQSDKIDCTHEAGYPFIKLSTVNFIKVNMRKADNIVWFDLNVWTGKG